MERFTHVTERKGPVAAARFAPASKHAPLYASPWMALFLVLRRELRQPRPAGN